MRTIYILGILVLLAFAVPAAPAHAGGVVTVCDEAHLLAALAGGGTVTFACSGTITLTAEIVIVADTTIDGSGQEVTISGNDAVRVFTVNEGVTLNLNGLRVAHGNASYAQLGGGIFNSGGTVSVNNCSISDNGARFGGGIYNTYPGTMTVSSSTISGNHADEGAGIYNDATLLTVNDSGITDNIASGNCGGGIYSNRGELIVANSIFSNNTVDYWGGGGICGYDGAISVSDSTFLNNSSRDAGGGIASNDGASIMVAYSTFSGNSASLGGGISSAGILTVTNSTFSGNSAFAGGGIASDGTVFVSGSTFSGNSSAERGGGISYGGRYNISLTVSNSTFIGNSAGSEGGGMYSSTSDGVTVSNSTLTGNSAGQQGGGVYSDRSILTLKNTIVANNPTGDNCSGAITDGGGNLSFPDTTCPGINADPLLGPLQNNGGPTQTMALYPGSAAIDAGDDAHCPATDQRGFSRPWGPHCDIGAVEQRIVSVCDEAHLLAALAGGGTVFFTCSGTITLANTITIAADTTIDGSGQSVTISGNNTVGVIRVNSGVSLNLNELAVANGYANAGGGILNHGTLTVADVTFIDNLAATAGGGIANGVSGVVFVGNSTFWNNRAVNASGGGGGVANSGTATVFNSTFSGNSSTLGRGGGIADFTGGTLTVVNSTFSDNSAAIAGGAISNRYGTSATLKNTVVIGTQTNGNCESSITDGGGNLSFPDTSCPGINADPMLSPLQNNGGPTLTMEPGPGSAAIDAGIDAICAAPPVNNLDQRGITRPAGAHCDIGAVERLPFRKWLPTILSQ